MENISIPVNSTMMNARAIKGTKGIALTELLLPGPYFRYIPTNAPHQIERINTASPCRLPKNAPTPKKRIISPKPRPFPLVTNQIRRNGSETNRGESMVRIS
jgi:hypothetical protein